MDDTGEARVFEQEADLRETMGETMEISVKKCIPSLDKHCKEFIRRSPFLCIGTSGESGRADVSPRGDPPGFVQVLDDNTLFIPDRPGNNRLDTMTNIIENPNVGLLFLVPGFRRHAAGQRQGDHHSRRSPRPGQPWSRARSRRSESRWRCRRPSSTAPRRSSARGLWDEESRQNRRDMPSLGRIILEQTAPPEEPPTEETVKETDEFVEENYRTELY